MDDTSTWRLANQNNVAYFSSIGPTYDGRIKPDILSPGMFVNAAKAADAASCDFHSEMGTSSATALTSGIAALVRQYYMDSAFHETVTSGSVPAFTPTGALLKATIIHTGQAMLRYFPAPLQSGWTTTNFKTEVAWGTKLGGPYDTGNQDSDADLPQVGDSNRPDFISGFGRINLKNALPLPGVSNWPFNLHAYDKVSVSSNTEYSWLVQMPATGDWLAAPGAEAGEAIFKATLVWMDPPRIPFVEKNLAHDLDLIITEVTSTSDNYPEPSASKPIWFGNGGASPDSTNNVEQISITSLTSKGRTGLKLNSLYRVTVRANVLTEASTQKFGLVLTTPKTNAGGAAGTASTVTVPDYQNVAATSVTAGLTAIEKICASDELQVEVTLSSHLAIGWQGGSRYTITKNAFSHTGTMNATQTLSQLAMTEVVCLPVGVYTVSLEEVTDTASTVPRDRYRSLGQTALDINDCFVHLQGMYGPRNATVEVKSVNNKLYCNYCDANADSNGEKHFPLAVTLYGSVYGGRISYGWENSTSYSIQTTPYSKTVAYNTLNQGIVTEHKYCLVQGKYKIGFQTFSSDDDFDSRPTKSTDWSADTWGIGEYKIKVTGCNGKQMGVISGYKQVTVNSGKKWVPNDVTQLAVDNVEASSAYCTQSIETYTLSPTPGTPNPTQSPTWSQAPTSTPTRFLQVDVILPLQQEFTTSLSASDFSANAAAVLAFRTSVFQKMKVHKCKLEDVVFKGCAATTRRRLAEADHISRGLAVGIIIDYELTVPTESTSMSLVNAVISSVAGTMAASSFVSSLTTALSAVAGLPSMTALTPPAPAASSVRVEITRSAAPSAAPTPLDASSSKGSSTGIIIGSVGGILVLGGILFAVFRGRKSAEIKHQHVKTAEDTQKGGHRHADHEIVLGARER